MDATVAAAWLRRAADFNQPQAQYELGACYYQGKGVPRDFTAASRPPANGGPGLPSKVWPMLSLMRA